MIHIHFITVRIRLRDRNPIMPGRKRHAAGSDDDIRQVDQMMADMIIETQKNIVREFSPMRGKEVGDTRSGRHNGIVRPALIFLMDLVETMGYLMRCAP